MARKRCTVDDDDINSSNSGSLSSSDLGSHGQSKRARKTTMADSHGGESSSTNDAYGADPKTTYRDYSQDRSISKPGDDGRDSTQTFPMKLHAILSNAEFSSIISWLPHGRAWRILQHKAFEEKVIPLYFRHGRYSSFARQVNGWGFKRIAHGPDYNSYYHEMFLRGLPHLCEKMKRLSGKDAKKNDDNADAPIPDFYALSRENPLPEDPSGATGPTAATPATQLSENTRLGGATNSLIGNSAIFSGAPVHRGAASEGLAAALPNLSALLGGGGGAPATLVPSSSTSPSAGAPRPAPFQSELGGTSNSNEMLGNLVLQALELRRNDIMMRLAALAAAQQQGNPSQAPSSNTATSRMAPAPSPHGNESATQQLPNNSNNNNNNIMALLLRQLQEGNASNNGASGSANLLANLIQAQNPAVPNSHMVSNNNNNINNNSSIPTALSSLVQSLTGGAPGPQTSTTPLSSMAGLQNSGNGAGLDLMALLRQHQQQQAPQHPPRPPPAPAPEPTLDTSSSQQLLNHHHQQQQQQQQPNAAALLQQLQRQLMGGQHQQQQQPSAVPPYAVPDAFSSSGGPASVPDLSSLLRVANGRGALSSIAMLLGGGTGTGGQQSVVNPSSIPNDAMGPPGTNSSSSFPGAVASLLGQAPPQQHHHQQQHQQSPPLTGANAASVRMQLLEAQLAGHLGGNQHQNNNANHSNSSGSNSNNNNNTTNNSMNASQLAALLGWNLGHNHSSSNSRSDQS